VFKRASADTWVSLRAFHDIDGRQKPFKITSVKLNGNLDVVVDKAYRDARFAAIERRAIVFCPPIATFSNSRHAAEKDLAEGLVLSVECDQHAPSARKRLETLFGPATVVVASGGESVDRQTGEVEPKLHLHFRLKVPARTKDELAALKKARELAAKLVGADPSSNTIVHPIRWPGSWHRKKEPRLCRIVSVTNNEVDLGTVLAALKQAGDVSADVTAERYEALGDEQGKVPLDIDKLIADIFHLGPGNGGNLHKSQLQITASLLIRYQPVDDAVIERVVDEVMEITRGVPGTEYIFDRKKKKNEQWERSSLRDKMCVAFVTGKRPDIADVDWLKKKHPQVLKQHPELLVEATQTAQVNSKTPIPDPIDLWAHYDTPPLPRGLLPAVIERYAFELAKVMGCDPAGLAMGALTICSAMIPDTIKLKVKQHSDGWDEEARLWTALVGNSASMKTPMIQAVTRPVTRIQKRMWQTYTAAIQAYEALPADERKTTPKPYLVQLRLEDTSIEAAQEAMRNNVLGMVTVQDELSGWFGSMERYSGGSGRGNRGFWLRSWAGGQYILNRVGRGTYFFENMGVVVLGGIQPEVIQEISFESSDDGLIQRLLAIILRPVTAGCDEPIPSDDEYTRLIEQLYQLRPDAIGTPNFFSPTNKLGFDDGAQAIQHQLEHRHLELQKLELFNKKLGTHVGKLNGYFARLCIIWHCIENSNGKLPDLIGVDTARRVAKFMSEFLLPHSLAFYAGVLSKTDDHDRLSNVAGYILAHKLERITTRDIARGDRSMRKLTRRDTEGVFEQLEALAWVTRVPGPRPSSPPQWVVNPKCHELFAERAVQEATRRKEAQAIVVEALKKVSR
jgi:hypothetical protein